MVPAGSFKHLFRQAGAIYVAVPPGETDEFELKLIEAGASDIEFEGELAIVFTDPKELQKTREGIEKSAIRIENAGLVFIPTQKAEIAEGDRATYGKFIERLDELDDVQEIYDNL